MITLGPISSGAARLAKAARHAVMECGEAAIFASVVTGEAAAIAYTAPDYAMQLRRHAEHLVGVYRDDVKKHYTHDVERQAELLREITDDLVEHLKLSRFLLISRCARKSSNVRAGMWYHHHAPLARIDPLVTT